MRTKTVGAALAAVIGLGLLTSCSSAGDEDLRYATGYSNHPPLAVVGYPSTGSLQITQEIIWAIADGDIDELESLAADDGNKGDVEKTSANWIKAFGKGAQGKVTADFYDEGSERQMVVLYFHDTSQIKQLQVRVTNDDGPARGWRVSMHEPDPKQVATRSPWVPKKPGGVNSTTPQ